MARTSTLAVAIVAVALVLGQAQAARPLAEPGASVLGRALKQVGDAFTRWGQSGYVDDGARTHGTVYGAVAGATEVGPSMYGGYNNLYGGYYGSPVAAAYYGSTVYPSNAQLALYRMNPTATSLNNRRTYYNARYQNRFGPYDF